MNKVIKKILNFLCKFLTDCINQGQKLMVRKESHSVWRIPKDMKPEEYKEDYARYRNNLRKYGFNPSKRDFYVFCQYLRDCGNDPALIVPSYVVHAYLTSVLNPIDYNNYFEDKNMMDKILPKGCMPGTALRRIDGIWYDENYNRTELGNWLERSGSRYEEGARMIIKPGKDSSSGKGIKIYELKEGEWVNVQDKSDLLSTSSIGKTWNEGDLIIQDVIRQSAFLSQFCKTSVNTLRMVIYNSPVDGEKHLIWCGIRIGAEGMIVDNNHAGGLIFGIDENGKIASYGIDQHGNKYSVFNGINFKEREFIIPRYEDIVMFAKNISLHLFPHRFIAFDISLDESEKPIIIEYNLRGYGGWAAQFSGSPMFGDKTDEILAYVSAHRKRARKFFYKIN